MTRLARIDTVVLWRQGNEDVHKQMELNMMTRIVDFEERIRICPEDQEEDFEDWYG